MACKENINGYSTSELTVFARHCLEVLLESSLSKDDIADTSDQSNTSEYNNGNQPAWHAWAVWVDVPLIRDNTWVLHKADLLVIKVPHDCLEAVENFIANIEDVIDISDISELAFGIDVNNGNVDKAVKSLFFKEVKGVKGNIVLIHVDTDLRIRDTLVSCSPLIKHFDDGLIDIVAASPREYELCHVKIIWRDSHIDQLDCVIILGQTHPDALEGFSCGIVPFLTSGCVEVSVEERIDHHERGLWVLGEIVVGLVEGETFGLDQVLLGVCGNLESL
jgi:hypothetical protein